MAKRIFLRDITADDCRRFRDANPGLSREYLRAHENLMYRAMKRLGIIDHLFPKHKKQGHDRESVLPLMKQYKHCVDFQRAHPAMYRWVRLHDRSLLTMFTPKANAATRGIYAYEFQDRTAYVGLTYNFAKRDQDHKSKERSPVYKHIAETGHSPEMKVLVDIRLTVDEAKQQEATWIERYRREGWRMLNRARAGALGTWRKAKYTQQQIDEAVAQCDTRKEFKQRFPSIFYYADRHHIPIDLHTPRPSMPLEELKATASQYATRGELKKHNPKAYNIAVKRHLLDTLYPGQSRQQWSRESIFEVVSRCNTFADFHMRNTNAYDAARRLGIMDEIHKQFEK